MTTVEGKHADVADVADVANGAALAAFVGAGIGAFAMGVLVILNEAGVFTAPTLYAPAGGVSGRTTFTVVIWLIGWAALHRRWISGGTRRSLRSSSPSSRGRSASRW